MYVFGGIFFKATNMVTRYSIQQSCLNEFKMAELSGYLFDAIDPKTQHICFGSIKNNTTFFFCVGLWFFEAQHQQANLHETERHGPAMGASCSEADIFRASKVGDQPRYMGKSTPKDWQVMVSPIFRVVSGDYGTPYTKRWSEIGDWSFQLSVV